MIVILLFALIAALLVGGLLLLASIMIAESCWVVLHITQISGMSMKSLMLTTVVFG